MEQDRGCQVIASDLVQRESRMIVYGGAARLPQFANNVSALLSIEIEIDRAAQSVLAVYVDPNLGGLKRLIEEAVVGQDATVIGNAGLRAVAERYHSPFRNAARAALSQAWEAYLHSLRIDAATPSKRPGMLASLSD